MAIAQAPGQYYAGKKEMEESQTQAKIVAREAEENAKKKLEEGKRFASEQELSYLKSGVMLEGSPLLVLSETGSKNLEESERIREAGVTRAKGLLRSGRRAFTSGLLQAAGSAGQSAASAGSS